MQTFAVVLLERRFGISQAAASGLIGLAVLGGGRVADWRVRHAHLGGRVSVSAAFYLIAVIVLVPALIRPLLIITMPFFFVGPALSRRPTLRSTRPAST